MKNLATFFSIDNNFMFTIRSIVEGSVNLLKEGINNESKENIVMSVEDLQKEIEQGLYYNYAEEGELSIEEENQFDNHILNCV